MFQKQIIKRIPGNSSPNPRERQGYIEDISAKTKVELLELLERQNKLLENKCFISKLPDKGTRILEFRSKIEVLLAQKDEIDQACVLLSGLDLNSSKNVPDEMEWTGKHSSQQETLDSDDDSEEEERDPLKILATQGGVGTYKKHHRVLKEEESLIKPADLKEIESFSSGDIRHSNGEVPSPKDSRSGTPNSILNVPEEDLYVNRLVDKLEKPREKKREPFKPYRTTASGVHLPSHVFKAKGPHWEVTAATPPHPVHGDAKFVSLQESLELQREQVSKFKEIQAKHAAERLAAQVGLKMGSSLPDPSSRNRYRRPPVQYDSSSSSDGEGEPHSEAEEEEDEEPERDGAVIYNITG